MRRLVGPADANVHINKSLDKTAPRTDTTLCSQCMYTATYIKQTHKANMALLRTLAFAALVASLLLQTAFAHPQFFYATTCQAHPTSGNRIHTGLNADRQVWRTYPGSPLAPRCTFRCMDPGGATKS